MAQLTTAYQTFYGTSIGYGPTNHASDATLGSDTYGGYVSNTTNAATGSVYGTDSGVYSGTLSSQGGMLAEQLNNSGPKKIYAGQVLNPETGQNEDVYKDAPWLTGYLREYWKKPTETVFGANTAMPALTSVMPASLTDTPGSFQYYLDLQLTRISGSNFWNTSYFINVFNQIVSWVSISNSYLAALKNAEDHNLAYFGANSFAELSTQNFSKYQKGQALINAIAASGLLVSAIPLGAYGTANGVAKSMLDNKLGYINGLAQELTMAGVNFKDIYNPVYTATISSILEAITSPQDLSTIQLVLETTVKDITSPLDLISIEKLSGLPNDSAYETLANAGKDLQLSFSNFTLTTGTQLATLISQVVNDSTASVENIGSTTSVLKPEIIEQLRGYLPAAVGNLPVSVLDVIGTPSGYLNDYLDLVNDGIAKLYKTSYGPQIRSIFSDISRYTAGVDLTAAELNAIQHYSPVPPGTPVSDEFGGTSFVGAGPSWLQVQVQKRTTDYYNLLNTLVNDPVQKTLVSQINDNYLTICQRISLENRNYIKANISVTTSGENSQYFSFVSTLPDYAVDTANIGTDLLLYGMCQPNEAGDLAKVVLNQSKNSSILANAGVKINGIL